MTLNRGFSLQRQKEFKYTWINNVSEFIVQNHLKRDKTQLTSDGLP